MENKNKAIFLLISISLIVFLIGNEQLFLFLNQKIASPVLDFIVLKIFIPLFLLMGIIPGLMLFSEKYRKSALFSLFSGVFCYLMGHLIKNFFRFPRPYDVLNARIIGPWHVGQFSFPSSTTMLAFGLALPFLFEKSKYRSFFLTLAFLVGFTVIYTGFHFPRDVVAGIIFSILMVFLINKIKNKWEKGLKI